MSRILALAYGVASYLAFLALFPYAIGFVGNLLVSKSIDSGPKGSLPASVLINTLLLLLFAVPHSVMARPAFKRQWTRFVPPPVERSTYVLVSSPTLGLLFWQWRAIPAIVWHVANPVGRWFLYASGREYTPLGFKTPGLYRYVRHPLMTGFLFAFWAAPTMTVGHLLFAGATTAYAYILIALQLEEQDLVSFHGEQYRAYREQITMLLPLPKPRRS